MSLENSCQSNSLLRTIHSFSPCFERNKCPPEVKRKKALVGGGKRLQNEHVMLNFSQPSELCKFVDLKESSLDLKKICYLWLSNIPLARRLSSFYYFTLCKITVLFFYTLVFKR